MTNLPLRPYQAETLVKVRAALAGGTNRPAVVQATGLGKTVTFSHLVADHCRTAPGRVLVLVHRDELAQQARNKIHSVAPALRPGIVMGQRHRDHDRQVIVASVPTLAREKRRALVHGVGMIVVDEAHHAAAPSWRKVLEHYGAWNGLPTVGFTATMSREDGRGLGEVWQDVVDTKDTLWGIRNGYLADVRGIRCQVPRLDLSGVHIRAGDLQQDEVGAAMLDANTGAAIVKAIQEFASDRRGVVFAPNVATAEAFAEEMVSAGIPTETIIGSTPLPERAAIFERFRTGVTSWLTNAMVLTEGWDAPWADCAVIARPTKSSGLYQQMIGRILRPWPAGGKQGALVLDMVGVTELHGLASLADLSMDRPVTPKDGQSLLEAYEEYDDEPDLQVTPPPVHSVVGTEVDMFGESHSVWLKTNAGTWFIPAGDMFFFLWPDGTGSYTLGMTPKARNEVARPIVADVTLELGMAWAEKYAGEYDPTTTGKDAPWRNQGRMTTGQKRDFAYYGISPGSKMTAAKAYDKLNIHLASARLGG